MNIAFLTGLLDEAKCISARGSNVVLCGEDQRQAMDQLLDPRNIDGIISFGTCGAIDPRIRVGWLTIGIQVVLADGTFASPDMPWAMKLKEVVAGYAPVEMVAVYSDSKEVAASPVDKARLFKRTRANTVDMGTFSVVQWAAKHKVPFAVIGGVSDGYDDTVTSDASVMNKDGSINVNEVIDSILRNPGDIFGFLKQAQNYSAALNSLRAADLALGPRYFR